jgi:hypothetical protein
MMDRRLFLKLTGVAVAASAIEALPVSADGAPASVAASGTTEQARSIPTVSAPFVQRLSIREPGEYRISGLVRLDEQIVTLSGIANSQQISRSGATGAEAPVVSFSTFERFDRAGLSEPIVVHGGRIESLTIEPIVFA